MRLPGRVLSMTLVCVVQGCQSNPPPLPADESESTGEEVPVGDALTTARAVDGRYVSWREHTIDDEATGGIPIQGGDGLVMADLELDGHLDIVSVHESDTEYDGVWQTGTSGWPSAPTTRINGNC